MEAARNGHLHAVQYLLTHLVDAEGHRESKKRKAECIDSSAVCGVGGTGMRRRCVAADLGETAFNALRKAAKKRHFHIVRWIFEQNVIKRWHSWRLEKVIRRLLEGGELELAEKMLQPNDSLVNYVEYLSGPQVIETLIESGDYPRDKYFPFSALFSLASTGRLDLIQQISEHITPGAVSSDHFLWRDALQEACKSGNVPVLRWFLEHEMAGVIHPSNLLDLAAGEGHLNVMQYVCELPDATNYYYYENALESAIREDQLEAVKFLLRQLLLSGKTPAWPVVRRAAHHGRLEMIKFFCSLETPSGLGIDPNEVEVKDTWWRDLDGAVEAAASDGYLAVVQWLTEHCSAPCSTEAMNLAASYGHLGVVQWLHENRSEGCTTEAMYNAAQNGLLHVVQWLHANRSEGCITKAMDLAAKYSHFKLVKWLYENRSEGCTAEAIVGCVRYGNVRWAYWLHTKFPSHKPRGEIVTPYTPHCFEMVKSIHSEFPEIFQKICPELPKNVQAWLDARTEGAGLIKSTSERC